RPRDRGIELVEEVRCNDEDDSLLAPQFLNQAQHRSGEHPAGRLFLLLPVSNELLDFVKEDHGLLQQGEPVEDVPCLTDDLVDTFSREVARLEIDVWPSQGSCDGRCRRGLGCSGWTVEHGRIATIGLRTTGLVRIDQMLL